MKKAWHQQVRRAPKTERTDTDGTVFDSKGELKRWKVLQLWHVAGDIRNLRRQVSYDLILPDGTPILTKTGKTMRYTADFVYERRVYETAAPSTALPPEPPADAPEAFRKQWAEARVRAAERMATPPLVKTDRWEEVIEDYKGHLGQVEALRIAVFEAIYKVRVTITGYGRKGRKING